MHRILARSCLCLTLVGCAGSAEPAPARENDSPSTSGGATAPAEAEPARHPALAPLRPAGSEAVLASLGETPGPRQHADAAAFYADTDAAGMTIVWGLTAGAINFDHAWRADVAAAMKRVLSDRIEVTEGGARTSVRLAPGATPALQQPDGSLLAPTAHLFETVFSAAVAPVAASRSGLEWTGETLRQVLDAYTQLAAQGTPIDSVAPINGWLVELQQAGHLDGFAVHVFDAATADDAAAVDAARGWVAAHPPTIDRATMPDDLVPM